MSDSKKRECVPVEKQVREGEDVRALLGAIRFSYSGEVTHGQEAQPTLAERADLQGGRQQGVQDHARPEGQQDGEERRRIGAHAGPGQEAEEEVADPPLVLIEWVDSFGCSPSWEHLTHPLSAPRLLVCRSVGWLVHDGDECKVVVPHLARLGPDDDDQGCGDMTIPTRAVVRVTPLLSSRDSGAACPLPP